MNRIAKRTYFAAALAFALLLGLIGFCVQYCIKAKQWVVASGSPHVYTQGALDGSRILDRSGETLQSSQDGEKHYADSAAVRRATMHLLGDRSGNVRAVLQRTYASDLAGFDLLNGVYRTTADAEGEMQLTVSAELQALALEQLDGRRGTVGIYNYKTGEILCAVSSPSYDPDDMPDIDGDTTGKYTGVYVNRFLQATYTPGSIFKLVTAAAALETIDDIASRTYVCDGSYSIGGDTVVCQSDPGTYTLGQALMYSCNSAFAQIALEVGPAQLTATAKKLGITKSLSFDGYETASGSFDLTDAEAVEVAWAGIGQYHDQINPCQYMTLMGAIANGGSAKTPYFVQSVSYGGRQLYRADPDSTGRLMREDTAAALAAMMRDNVTDYYGASRFPNVAVCAKTGTAEIGDGKVNSTFAGFVQEEQYPLAFIVVVEDGGAGGTTCIPILSTVLSRCIALLDAES